MTSPDPILYMLTEQREQLTQAQTELYTSIRTAKRLGYSFRDIAKAAGLPLGTTQSVIAGRNPRIRI